MTVLNNNIDANVNIAFLCPIREIGTILCDRPAVHLINSTAICAVHAKRLANNGTFDVDINSEEWANVVKEEELKMKQGLEWAKEFMAGKGKSFLGV
jgi:hypothetical protein